MSLSEEQPEGRYRAARRKLSDDVFDTLGLDPLKEYKVNQAFGTKFLLIMKLITCVNFLVIELYDIVSVRV